MNTNILEDNLPKDVSGSITTQLGEGASINLRCSVRAEIRPDKLEPKALVLTDHRIYVFANKSPARVEISVHFLELRGITSSDNKLTFVTEGRDHKIFLQDAKHVDCIIHQLAESLQQVFPHLPLESLVGKLDISPPGRLQKLMEEMKGKKIRQEIGPCGNFSLQYRCMCDFHNQPYLDEVAWDIDTIYLSLNSTCLMLSDFDHLDGKHLVPIISTMAYNNWFTALCGCDVKMTPEALNEFAAVTRSNTSLETYCMTNAGVKGDFASKMSAAWADNLAKTSINHLVFNGNQIDDRGMLSLCQPLSKLPKGARVLQFSKCALTPRSINKLAEALMQNSIMVTSLTRLDLSGNSFKDDITNLTNFLATPNALTSLNLSSTECALDNIFGALIRGCSRNLVTLDLSSNIWSKKSSKGDTMVPVAWKQFFASALALKEINLAGNRLPQDAIKNLLLGLSSNSELSDVSLNLSSNGMGSVGGGVVEACLADNTNITTLDISDNNLEGLLAKMLDTFGKRRTIKKLAIGKNFNNIKPKTLQAVLESVINLIQDEDSSLESLSLADSKLKADTALVINALGGNQNLTELDISGNLMGDMGARVLMKALCINNKLRQLYWDSNNTLPQGFTDIATAMNKNFVVQVMPIPVQDLAVALRADREKTQKAIHQIESHLQRNNSANRFAAAQSYRLQQSLFSSATHDMVDRYVTDIMDCVANLEKRGEGLTAAEEDDIDKARALMKDAENSRHLLSDLQKVCERAASDVSDVNRKLGFMSDDLQATVEKQLKETVATMLSTAQSQCSTVLSEKSVSETLRQDCLSRAQIEPEFSQAVLREQSGPSVLNKVSEVSLSVALHISERMFDALLAQLDYVNKKLSDYVRKGESALDAIARSSIRRSNKKDEEASKAEDGSQRKSRKSVYSLRMRPQSQVAPPHAQLEASNSLSESQDTELDDFVFVDQDDDDKQSISFKTPASPGVNAGSLPRGTPPQKPPPPKFGTGCKSEEKSVDLGGSDEPHAPPRRKHKRDTMEVPTTPSKLSVSNSSTSVSSAKIEPSPQLVRPPAPSPPTHVWKVAKEEENVEKVVSSPAAPVEALSQESTTLSLSHKIEASPKRAPPPVAAVAQESNTTSSLSHKIEASPHRVPPPHVASSSDKQSHSSRSIPGETDVHKGGLKGTPPGRPTQGPHRVHFGPKSDEPSVASPTKVGQHHTIEHTGSGSPAASAESGKSEHSTPVSPSVAPPRPPPAIAGSLERGKLGDLNRTSPADNGADVTPKPPIPERPSDPKRSTLERLKGDSEVDKMPPLPDRPPPPKPMRLSMFTPEVDTSKHADKSTNVKEATETKKEALARTQAVDSDEEDEEDQSSGDEQEPETPDTSPPTPKDHKPDTSTHAKRESKTEFVRSGSSTGKAKEDVKEVEEEEDEEEEEEEDVRSDNSLDRSGDHGLSTGDQTDSLSTSQDSLLEDSRESTPGSEKSSRSGKPRGSSGKDSTTTPVITTTRSSGKSSKSSAKKKTHGSTSSTDGSRISEFDTLAPLGDRSTKLTHLTKNRAQRVSTARPSRAHIKSEAYVIEDIGGAGMDDFFESKPVPKSSRSNSADPVKSPKPSISEEGTEEKSEVPKKKGMKPLFGGIDLKGGLSKFLGKSSPKSPRDKASPKTPEDAPSKLSPIAPTPPEPVKEEPDMTSSVERKSLARELEEEKQEEKKDEVKPLSRRPPGAIGMPGLGGTDLLAEMRAKRRTMMNDGSKDGSKNGGSADDKENGPNQQPPKPAIPALKPVGTRLSGGEEKPLPPVKPRPVVTLKPTGSVPTKPGAAPTAAKPQGGSTKAPAPPAPISGQTRGSADDSRDDKGTANEAEDRPTGAELPVLKPSGSRLSNLLRRDAGLTPLKTPSGDNADSSDNNNAKSGGRDSGGSGGVEETGGAKSAPNKQFEVYL